ncbi:MULTISPECIES: phage tail terminator protein [unclassified Marinimicrobium]|jgi:hypothetical protein|uniref:phage tail terminator protein n=1 Tax=unclassified Marinimicrobium TaxID=2632100 RepID=UPI000C618E5B|nr:MULTISPECIES: hypothetical protein [unclassified Marinimicrobium]MAN51214.1 hypothetical protein [Marinimicrobium sp.]|tara:strand:+ start:58 stop:495 length:438 start_codon:yes stop_codon:yes gene_type:complete
MSSAPFDTAPVIARVREQVTALRAVEGAASFAAVQNLRDFVVPGAYVVLTRERPDNQEPRGGRQRAIVTLGVVVAVRNYRDVTGGELKDALNPILNGVRNALIGWTPPEQGARPMKWAGGDVIDYDDNTLLWGDVFQTQHFIGAA